jgi:hypothetical protein
VGFWSAVLGKNHEILIPIWKWECGFGFAELTFRNTKSAGNQMITLNFLRIQSFVLVLMQAGCEVALLHNDKLQLNI